MRPGVASIRTLIVVTVLAMLAWVLAESQTLRTESVTVRVSFDDGRADQAALGPVVRVEPGQGWEGSAEVHLAGSAALIDQLLDELRGGVRLTVGRELSGEPGTRAVDLREALRRAEPIRDSGVTVDSVEPASVSVEVDQLEAVEAPVQVRVPDGAALAGPPRAVPETVRVVGPASALGRVGEGAAAIATLTDADLAPLVPGRDETVTGARVTVPEALAGQWGVQLQPPRVDVVVQVRSKSATLTIPRLPVQIMLAPSELGRWTIAVEPADQDLTDLTLTGPQEQIDRVRRGEIRPTAVVALSFEELESGIGSKRATVLGLPAGVRYEVARDEVRLKIERAGDGEAGAGPPGP